MSAKHFILASVAVALGLLTAGLARGEMWTYSGSIDTGWRDSTGRFAVIHPGIIHWEPAQGGIAPTWEISPHEGIVFTGIAGTANGSRTAPAFFVGAVFPATLSLTDVSRDQFLPWFSTFTLKFSIQDRASHMAGAVSLPGYLVGNQDDGGARFTAYYGTYPPLLAPPTSPLQLSRQPLSQRLTLGDNVYTVTANPFTYTQFTITTPPDYVPTTQESVQVTVAPLSGTVAATPEPSAILLVLTGLAGLTPLVRQRMRY
jgi:hypothetical protein